MMGNSTSEEVETPPAPAIPTYSRTPAHLGQRVVRGPAWKWDNQDGGDGHVGTLIIVEQPWSEEEENSPFCVRVLWENGMICNYRASPSKECDLRLFDSGPVGAKFPTIICDVCCTRGIVGTRWKCDECIDYDLCHTCYMSDMHNLKHAFLRFDEPGASGVKVPPREGSVKVEVHGIFEGAQVQRSAHWKWHDQDGGKGSIGIVKSVDNWGDDTVRSAARVHWPSGTTARKYRIGHGGDVDLKCTVPASGGHFYRDHMPLIAPVKVRRDSSNSASPEFCEGDRIAITLDLESFKFLQNGHGGWNPLMEKIVNRMGTVQNVDSDGDVRVSVQTSYRFTVNPAALVKVPIFAPGDVVTLIDDQSRVRSLQEGHGGFVGPMVTCLGKKGIVVKVFRSHDVGVLIGETTWTYNPLCLNLLTRQTESDFSSRLRESASGSDITEEITRQVLGMILSSSQEATGLSSPTRPSRYSAGQRVKICSDKERVKRLQRGHGGHTVSMDRFLGQIGTIISVDSYGDLRIRFPGETTDWCYNPECVERVDGSDESANESESDSITEFMQRVERMTQEIGHLLNNQCSGIIGKTGAVTPTMLHRACFEGNEAIVWMMAETGANVEEVDEDGDRALHYATYGDKPDVIELLLNLGADINATNKKKFTALQVAVKKKHVNCVRVLINKFPERLDVNIQDGVGDTPLHDAIKHSSPEITDMLVNFPSVDFTLCNESGYNLLHQAAVTGNNFATEVILSKKPDLVDVKDSDGCTALHLAARANNYSVARTLVTQGKCTVDLKNTQQQTALFTAVFTGNCALIELLLGAGADINTTNKDGDTPMHMALAMRSHLRMQSLDPAEVEAITAIVKKLLENPQPGVDSTLALASFLAAKGADLHRKNKYGKTPLEMAGSAAVVELLLSWQTQKGDAENKVGSTESAAAAGDAGSSSCICKICLEADADVWFEPCGHHLYCSECCRRMKCCLECSVPITGRVAVSERFGGSSEAGRQAQRELEARLQQLEEAHSCGICMERQRNVIFLCGHGACDVCVADLEACHMCRETITKKITIY
ncbi:E3 ubiquitin-protein ligase MIB2-like isoform X2 [Dermacentor variabilis]|uniref:E3 ubiquitin-protein ligase MIB2-like isoform X2 n=1 Tax=Dermacentor variabilis TaxID=34621 RepID=UPI003F5BF9EC